MMSVPPVNETCFATIPMYPAVVEPFEKETEVVGKYKLPVSFMAAPPANVALLPDVIDRSWKKSTPSYGADVGPEKVTLAPLAIVTEA